VLVDLIYGLVALLRSVVLCLQNAKQLSWDILLRKWAPVAGVGSIVTLMLYWRFIGF